MRASVVIIGFLTIWGLTTAQYHFNLDGNEYKFSFKTGDVGDHRREEARDTFGTVIGKYSYVDPFGHRREMRYRADENGFQPEGYAVSRPIIRVRVPDATRQVPEVIEQEQLREAQEEGPASPDSDLSKAQFQALTEETETEDSTRPIEDETEVTEPESVTTDEPIAATTRASTTTTTTREQSVTNSTEVNFENDSAIPTPTSQIIKQVEDNSIGEVVPPPTREQLKQLLRFQQPEYPTVLRSPPIPELSLPVAFYHPYRLFNSNARPIPYLRHGNPGPITFF